MIEQPTANAEIVAQPALPGPCSVRAVHPRVISQDGP
jgi:hypothetical protein